jgi:hypothetical protein
MLASLRLGGFVKIRRKIRKSWNAILTQLGTCGLFPFVFANRCSFSELREFGQSKKMAVAAGLKYEES